MNCVHKDQVTRNKIVDLLHVYLRVMIFSQKRSPQWYKTCVVFKSEREGIYKRFGD